MCWEAVVQTTQREVRKEKSKNVGIRRHPRITKQKTAEVEARGEEGVATEPKNSSHRGRPSYSGQGKPNTGVRVHERRWERQTTAACNGIIRGLVARNGVSALEGRHVTVRGKKLLVIAVNSIEGNKSRGEGGGARYVVSCNRR